MSENIIEVKNFSKKYGNFTAVDNISFDVKEGSIFAFLGPNGAGKSTTINTLCTIFDKTEGEMKINSFDVSKEKDKVRQSIGIVFQDQTLDEKMSVYENLKMHCIFYNIKKNEIDSKIDFALNLVGLNKWKHIFVSGLSGGMKRRVEIARGLVHLPKVLFLDEPTTGLDPQTRASIWEYIVQLQKKEKITIFLTTHYMDEAEVCDKVAIMDHGKIVALGTPQELKNKYTTDYAYVDVSDDAQLEKMLEENNFTFEKKHNKYYKITITNLSLFLEIVSELKDIITEIEIKKGTLNDVFLNITGYDIREETK